MPRQGPQTLAELQNLVKRDPEAYTEEFMQQYRHYQSIREIMRLKPSQQPDKFGEMVMFMAQVSQCFPKVLSDFADDIMALLSESADVLEPELRQTLCRALFLMRNKGLVSSSTVRPWPASVLTSPPCSSAAPHARFRSYIVLLVLIRCAVL